MKGWLPRFAVLGQVTPGLFEGEDDGFFYGRTLVIQWRSFVLEITFARSDEVMK